MKRPPQSIKFKIAVRNALGLLVAMSLSGHADTGDGLTNETSVMTNAAVEQPAEGQAPAEEGTAVAEPEAVSAETVTNVVEAQAQPAEIVTNAVEVQPQPAEVPAVVSATVTNPPEFQTPPVEVKTPPVEVKTPPVEVKTPPVEVKTPPVEVKTPPVEVKTPPVEVKTPPVMTKPATVVPSVMATNDAPIIFKAPLSVFVIPTTDKQGRDPFFPDAARYSVPVTTNGSANEIASTLELTLQGISGAPEKRYAIINERVFGQGEEGFVTMSGGKFRIRCAEIKSNSVIVEVGSERRELRLRKNR